MAESVFSTTPRTALSTQRARLPYGSWSLRAAAVSYLALFVAVPILVISIEGFRHGLDLFWTNITRPAALSAIWLTIWTAAVMSVINVAMGTLTAYVLVKYKFPGKRILNSLIDLPFAIPTLVTGVMLILLYGPQTTIGGFFDRELGFRVLFAPPGIVIALLFISYPFVIRAVQPVLLSMDANQQDAAHTLGASDFTTLRRVIFPVIRPAMLSGALLSFARALGEFGAVVLVAGNIPMQSQTATVYIYGQVEGGDMTAASAISVVLLGLAFFLTLFADHLQRKHNART
jgi:sulfate/thiosulfate transport system permease protein